MSEHGKQEQTPLHTVMAQNPYLQCPSSQQIASLRLIGAHCRMIEHLLTLPMLRWHSHTPSGHDPDKTGSSLTDTLIITETAKVLVATPNHSKCLSGNSSFPPLIICVNFLLVYYQVYAEDETIPLRPLLLLVILSRAHQS